MNLTVGIFGDQELAKKLGKKGTTNDIALYNHASSEGVFTYACPNSDKVQPLLQTLQLVDVPVLVANVLSKEMGEMMVGIDEMGFEKGFIICSDKQSIAPIIKGSILEKFEYVDESSLWQKLLEVKIERKASPLMVPIDNYFNVKGVGTVVLSLIRSGTVKVHDKVMVEPLGKEAVVKGIQSQDKDIDEAGPGIRVGLNLKGVEADDLKRGYIICNGMSKASDITLKFTKSRYSREELREGMNVMLSAGLQVVSCRVEATSPELKLKANQPIAFEKGQRCIVASMGETYPRITGSGFFA